MRLFLLPEPAAWPGVFLPGVYEPIVARHHPRARVRIQSVITFNADGEVVSSIWPHSFGSPVVLVCSR